MSTKYLILLLLFLFVSSIYGYDIKAKDDNGNLIFSHKHEMHRNYDCDLCHIDIRISENEDDRNIPEMESCTICHDGVRVSQKCGLCHKGGVKGKDVKKIPNPIRTIRFSHKQHLELKRSYGCQNCHLGMNNVDYGSNKNLPTEKVCFGCHDGISLSQRCDICHKKPVKPPSHSPSWKKNHRGFARIDEMQCSNCHYQSSCIDCHESDNVKPKSHQRNFFYTHPQEVKNNTSDCSVCHTMDTFCVNCHQSSKKMPRSHSKGNWNSYKHAQEARNDISACAICHEGSNSTCLRCHK